MSPPHVTIRIVSGQHAGEQFTFDSHQTLVVGRAPDAQWRMLHDPSFSRYHFRIEVNPPHCVVEDLGSANGTRVNGNRAQRVELASGDRIECGDTTFEVTIVAAVNQAGVSTLDIPAQRRSPVAPLHSRIAGYEITRQLGHGGMGIVYHAVESTTGRELAVKIIRPGVNVPADAMQLFLREAAILGRLVHPRIVACYSAGLHEGQMFLAMEYVPTVDFRKLLATQSRPKQVRLACGIICRVLEGLQHAHEQDIVHRDVKPPNILVYKQGGKLRAKLADFGLAKNYSTAGLTSVTRESEVRGTLGFMAPEQLINCRYAKPPCDIYATGACLYYFLSGKLPRSRPDGTSDIGLILNAAATSLAVHAPDLPPELIKAVDRSLAREPGDRFSSAEHMRRVLLRFTEKQ